MGILKWNFLVERLLELNAAKAEVITMLSTILGALPAWPLGLLSWRRPRAYLGDRHYSGSTRTNLTICAG